MTTNRPLNPWPEDERWAQLHADAHRGGAEYHQLLTALRALQDQVAGATPPPEVSARIATQLAALAGLLAGHRAGEAERWDGWHTDLPGRGLPVLPPYVIDEATESTLRGRVTFSRFHLGGGGAAHGGTPPLLFDDVFGRMANHGYPGVARTAYLKIDYRRITPIDVELQFRASRDRVEGRKRWVSGQLFTADGDIACEAEGLFIQLLPGQP
ncbi:MAG: PaaI family thioesterase [Jatrophihabitantaceae bacterium]